MSISDPSDRRRPPLWMVAREMLALLRGLHRFARGRVPPGTMEGRPLMVIPGFLANDRSTLGLQYALAAEGYRVSGWGLGLNRGARHDLLDRLSEQVERHGGGEKVMLVGWSLGGVYARELARRRPDLVSGVVTLGSPFSGDRRSNNAWRLYQWVAGHRVDAPPIEPMASKPPVPTLALWSRRDGIVAPASARGAQDERDDHEEIGCSHMGFAMSKRAFPRIAAGVRRCEQYPPSLSGGTAG